MLHIDSRLDIYQARGLPDILWSILQILCKPPSATRNGREKRPKNQFLKFPHSNLSSQTRWLLNCKMNIGEDMLIVLMRQGTIQIRQFLGRPEDFGLWIVSIRHFLHFKDLSNKITAYYGDQMPADDVILSRDNAEPRPLIAIWENNVIAVSVIIALQILKNMITLCTRTIYFNEDHSNELACKLFEAINKKMCPDDEHAQMGMEEEIIKLKVRIKRIWTTQLRRQL